MADLAEHIEQHKAAGNELMDGVDGALPQLINGALVQGDGDPFDAIDPFLNQPFGAVSTSTPEQVDQAVAAARAAQPGWAALSDRKRGAALKAIADALRANKSLLGKAESVNAGIPNMVASRFSVAAMIRHYEYYGEWADKIYGSVIPGTGGKVLDYTLREPHGVVATITAWNSPSLFMGSKVAPALAAGNTVVLKPSESCPLPGQILARAIQDAGIPEGVINIVYGGPETGTALTTHPDVDMVTFTGGTAIGEKISAQAGLKPICLELGGKSPSIVLPDADLDKTVFGLIGGAFALSGQACAASSRIIVHQDVYDQFVEKFSNMVGMMALGDPLDGTTVLGPLISERQLARTMEFIGIGNSDGELVFGGEQLTDGIFAQGNFVQPTLFANVPLDSRLAREEVFGPVCCLFKYSDLDQAIAIANDTEFGLAGSIWTKSVNKAHRLAASLNAGFVWINAYGNVPYTAPFGGYKSSGHGREGGLEGILEFTRTKNVFVQL